jgi:hypothetical protein
MKEIESCAKLCFCELVEENAVQMEKVCRAGGFAKVGKGKKKRKKRQGKGASASRAGGTCFAPRLPEVPAFWQRVYAWARTYSDWPQPC